VTNKDSGLSDAVITASAGRCPHCGAATLFDNMVGFAPKCRACDLDFGQFNVGDGPAAFLILIIGGIISGLAIWVELAFEPAWWVHVSLWVPLTLIGVVYSLRFGKALLLVLEYRHQAREGHLVRPD
jgi:uncharacterized protein (DUF983 family)